MRLAPSLLTLAMVSVLLTGCTVNAAGSPSTAEAPVDLSPAPPDSASLSTTPSAQASSTPSPSASATPTSSHASSATASAPLLLTGGPLQTPTAPDPAPIGSFVLGDSISLSVAPTLSRLGYPVTGRVGQTITSDFLREHLASSTAQDAPAWVIVLGTNNRGDETDIVRLEEWLSTIKDLRTGRPRQHVYWVTPHRPEEYDGGLRDHDLDAFNDALRAAAAERRWLHVLDFATPAGEHPEWFAQDGGRLHPGEEGQAALADLIAGPDAPLADQPRAITELTWPTPEPTLDLTEEQKVYQDLEFSNG